MYMWALKENAEGVDLILQDSCVMGLAHGQVLISHDTVTLDLASGHYFKCSHPDCSSSTTSQQGSIPVHRITCQVNFSTCISRALRREVVSTGKPSSCSLHGMQTPWNAII